MSRSRNAGRPTARSTAAPAGEVWWRHDDPAPRVERTRRGDADPDRLRQSVLARLVEGYKRESFPKIEIYRATNGKPLLHGEDEFIVAVASDTPLPNVALPVVDLNDIAAVADALLKHAVPLEKVSA